MAATDTVPGDMSQQRSDTMDEGYRILAYLLAGLLLYGGLGWLGDHFFHTRFLLPLGLILGTGLGLYLAIKRHLADEADETERKEHS